MFLQFVDPSATLETARCLWLVPAGRGHFGPQQLAPLCVHMAWNPSQIFSLALTGEDFGGLVYPFISCSGVMLEMPLPFREPPPLGFGLVSSSDDNCNSTQHVPQSVPCSVLNTASHVGYPAD